MMTIITDYIDQAPTEQQSHLQQMYDLIKSKLPNATETFKYQMPTFANSQNIVHFAGMKQHLGFYPQPETIAHFAKELAPYKTSKGAVQFQYSQDLPVDLINKMLDYRISLEK